MREDYDEIGHYVRSLSRILLLIAVIIAVPLILSTITAFVRNQSNVSTFHDLLATASGTRGLRGNVRVSPAI